ncbi:hypothetical protein Q0F99_08915 [Rathayibacter oskolensis]|nr:hypothetical protein [Rathayibacter oskolensis]WKK72966.1 hypothetical protein Q0F99_08915 [Rathayibacter oskolensis]
MRDEALAPVAGADRVVVTADDEHGPGDGGEAPLDRVVQHLGQLPQVPADASAHVVGEDEQIDGQRLAERVAGERQPLLQRRDAPGRRPGR